jgi:hypothetical protein
MRDLLIQYLNNPNDGNLLTQFIYVWVKDKVPSRKDNEIIDFVNLFMNYLISVPSMFDSRYKEALDSLLTQAQIELKVNHLKDKNGNILQYL